MSRRGSPDSGRRGPQFGTRARAIVLPQVMLLVLLSGLAGCADIQSYLVEEETGEPPAELKEFVPTLEITEVWSAQVGDGVEEQYLKLRPVIAEGRLYATDREGRVSAYDRTSGDELWTSDLDLDVTGGPGVGPGTVLIGTGSGEVLALEAASGEVRWRARVSSEVLAPPISSSDIVIARTGDGKLFGLALDTGKRRWTYDRTVPVLSLRGTSTPVIEGPLVVAGFDNGRMVALRLDDGLTAWEQRVAVPRGRSELERLVDIDADPTILDGVIYAVSFQGRVVAMDIRGGEIIWQRDMSSYAGLGVGRSNVYVSDEKSHLWALDRNNSGSLWRQQELSGRALTAPIVSGEHVIVADFEGYVHWLAAEDGRVVGRTQVGDSVLVAPLLSGDLVFVYDRGGTITALRAN